MHAPSLLAAFFAHNLFLLTFSSSGPFSFLFSLFFLLAFWSCEQVKKSSMVRKGSRKSGSSGGSDDGAGKVLGTFEAKYVASVPVAERKGEKVVLDAIDDAFEEASSGGTQSFIQVTPEGVKCIDAVSQNVAWNIFLKEVSFTTVRCASLSSS